MCVCVYIYIYILIINTRPSTAPIRSPYQLIYKFDSPLATCEAADEWKSHNERGNDDCHKPPRALARCAVAQAPSARSAASYVPVFTSCQ